MVEISGNGIHIADRSIIDPVRLAGPVRQPAARQTAASMTMRHNLSREESEMTFADNTLIAIAVLALAGCGKNPDAVMWDCQLAVQRGNAGRSAADAAERARDIDACLSARGYRLDTGNPACRYGTVTSTCYVSR
jgi:hypothetical protein